MAHSSAFIHLGNLETSNLVSFVPPKYLANLKLVFVVSSHPPPAFKPNDLKQKGQKKSILEHRADIRIKKMIMIGGQMHIIFKTYPKLVMLSCLMCHLITTSSSFNVIFFCPSFVLYVEQLQLPKIIQYEKHVWVHE